MATLLFAFTMMAQPPKDGKGERRQFSPEEFEKRMENFVAKRANLTNDEQTKFFPLLKEMLDAQRKLGNQGRKMQKPENEPTEEECKKIISDMTSMELQRNKIEQTYYTKKFPTVLSYKKILKVRMALDQFKMEALRQFSPHKRGGKQPPKEK